MDENSDTKEVPMTTPWDQPPPAPQASSATAFPADVPVARGPQPPRRRSRFGFLVLILGLLGLGGVVVLVIALRVVSARMSSYGGGALANYTECVLEEGDGENRVMVVDIRGVISSDEGCGPLAMAQLRRLRRKKQPKKVKAVLLRVNSPGGTVTACDNIDGEIRKCKDAGYPFLAFYEELSASGGYYVSARANPIIARPTCTVGSIGVVSVRLNVQKMLQEKLGVEAEAMTSVPFKDAGSPLRPMKEEERKYFQKIIDDHHARFVRVVREGRGLSETEVGAFADGRVFLAEEAKKLKMIDQLGDWDDAIAAARKIAGKDAPLIGYRRKPSPLEVMLQSRGETGLPRELRDKLEAVTRQRFCYLWLP